MRVYTGLLLLAAVLGGCSSQSFRYQADSQLGKSHVSADYTMAQDNVVINIDSDSRRVEDVFVQKADGVIVRPVSVVHPAPPPPGLDSCCGARRAMSSPPGPTGATFATAALGPQPWMVHVNVTGLEPAVIRVGEAPSAK